jgi:DNA-binding MarR family transcriptional regulator
MLNKNNAKIDPAGTITDGVLVAIRKIIQSIAMNSRSLVKRVGLTGPQLMILQEVVHSDEISVGEVAKAISLSQGTVTGIVERLEKRKLVSRRRSDSDRRRVLVQATEAGKALMQTAPPLMQEAFVERFSALQDWEQAMILSSLQRLVTIMGAKTIQAAPILATGPIDESAAKSEPEK